MLMNKILTTVFALLCFTAAAMAQNVTVTGTITDAKDGAPVIASVIEQGTTNGAMADIDGNYSISVPEGAVLEFSSIGYVTVTKTVTPGIGRIDVVMQQDMQELEEVVVTALGIKRQEKALSYNTQTVDSDELTRVKDANMINSLVGKVAGVTIQQASGVIEFYEPEHTSKMGMDDASIREHEEVTKVKNIQDEVNRRGKQLENELVDFQNKINKGLITRSVAEVQGQDLQQKQAQFNEYANQKNNEVIEEQTVMMNQIADAIQTFMAKYNQEKKYTMILTNQSGVPVITADPSLDITDDVIARLNEEYIKEKNKNNK